MTARDRREVSAFFAALELRIDRELSLALTDGIRQTARAAAMERARQYAADLDYLRDRHALAGVTK